MSEGPAGGDSLWDQWTSSVVYAVRFFGLNTWNKLRWGNEAGGPWSRTTPTQARRPKVDLEMTSTPDEKDTRASSKPTTYYDAIYELQEGEEDDSASSPFYWEDDCNVRSDEPVNEDFQDVEQAPRVKKQTVRQNSIITTHEIYKHDLWRSSSQPSLHEDGSSAQTPLNKIHNNRRPKSKDPGLGQDRKQTLRWRDPESEPGGTSEIKFLCRKWKKVRKEDQIKRGRTQM